MLVRLNGVRVVELRCYFWHTHNDVSKVFVVFVASILSHFLFVRPDPRHMRKSNVRRVDRQITPRYSKWLATEAFRDNGVNFVGNMELNVNANEGRVRKLANMLAGGQAVNCHHLQNENKNLLQPCMETSYTFCAVCS